jgi:hypothetical protein
MDSNKNIFMYAMLVLYIFVCTVSHLILNILAPKVPAHMDKRTTIDLIITNKIS